MQPDKNLWAPRIYTPHGFVKNNLLEGVRALDVGCGDRKLSGATGVDILALPSVDVVHDLSVFPWPFADNSFDLILANHFMEHATDVVKTLEEICRILAPGGHVVIQVPYFRSTDAFTDPTHRHFFTSQSFDYVVAGDVQARYRYSATLFEKLGFWYGWPHPSKNPLKQLLKSFIAAHPEFYDQYLSILLPTECLTWELEKVS